MRRVTRRAPYLLLGLFGLAAVSACASPVVGSVPLPKTAHSPEQQSARLDDVMGALATLCIDESDPTVIASHMARAGFAPVHRKTRQPADFPANDPVIWRKVFNGGHDGAISISDADGTCLGLYQNIAFDQQPGEDAVAAGAETVRKFAQAKGYWPLDNGSAIKLNTSDPPAAIGQFEGPRGKVTIMIAHSPGDQILDGDRMATRLGGVRFLVVAGAQHT